jgi:hypothetical protein
MIPGATMREVERLGRSGTPPPDQIRTCSEMSTPAVLIALSPLGVKEPTRLRFGRIDEKHRISSAETLPETIFCTAALDHLSGGKLWLDISRPTMGVADNGAPGDRQRIVYVRFSIPEPLHFLIILTISVVIVPESIPFPEAVGRTAVVHPVQGVGYGSGR